LHIVSNPRRRPLAIALVALFALAAVSAALLVRSAAAPADNNPNNYDCRGHIQAGEPSADEPDATQVKYSFACNGPITGFQIQPDHAVQSMETEVFGADKATGAVIAADAFSCNGDLPGYGINCVGAYQGNYDLLSGQFSIDEKLCDEPRIDTLLTVMYATADSKGKVTQAISGPFELGRPHGCPKSALGGKTRIPADLR
jgi:hypothetical protein